MDDPEPALDTEVPYAEPLAEPDDPVLVPAELCGAELDEALGEVVGEADVVAGGEVV